MKVKGPSIDAPIAGADPATVAETVQAVSGETGVEATGSATAVGAADPAGPAQAAGAAAELQDAIRALAQELSAAGELSAERLRGVVSDILRLRAPELANPDAVAVISDLLATDPAFLAELRAGAGAAEGGGAE